MSESLSEPVSDPLSNLIILRFSINPQLSDPTDARVRSAVEQALSEAIAEAGAGYEMRAA